MSWRGALGFGCGWLLVSVVLYVLDAVFVELVDEPFHRWLRRRRGRRWRWG